MPQIKKVLNSSVILVLDDNNKEIIVLQKGIGYGRKPGQDVELNNESQIFVPVSELDRRPLLELLEEIPYEYLEICKNVVNYAETQLNTTLNAHIYLALTDHLHFAVERIKENMIITNRVFYELKTFYPKEYQIGLYALELMKEKMQIELPLEEAANIAFHIVNAQKADSQYDAMRAAKLIGQIMTLTTYYMNCQPDTESIHYSRFVSHLQFFAERFFTNRMLEDKDDFLYMQIESAYPKALACAERVRTLILTQYNVNITNEEVVYLAVHIERLSSRK